MAGNKSAKIIIQISIRCIKGDIQLNKSSVDIPIILKSFIQEISINMQVFVISVFIVLLSIGQLNAAEVRRDDKVNGIFSVILLF